MPYSDYRPDLMGSATLTPSGSFEAGSLQSFTLVYTAGAFGVDDTGSIKIGFRFATDFGPVQFTDPKGQGYTTVEASNGATLEAKWEFKRNIRPWSRVALHRRGEGLPGARRHHHHPLRRPPAGLARHPRADLLRERVRVPRLRRPDRHLRLRGAAGEPEDLHRAGAGRALARRAADAGARRRAVPPVDQGRRQMGQSLQPRRSHAAARGRWADRGSAGDAALRAGRLCGGGRGLRVARPGDCTSACSTTAGQELCRSQSAAGRGERRAARPLLGRHARPVQRDARHQHGARVFRVRPRQGLPRRHGPPGQRLPDHGRVLARAQRADARVRRAGPVRVHPRLRVVGQHGRGRRPQRALPARGRDHPPLLARPDRRCRRHRRRERGRPHGARSCSRS